MNHEINLVDNIIYLKAELNGAGNIRIYCIQEVCETSVSVNMSVGYICTSVHTCAYRLQSKTFAENFVLGFTSPAEPTIIHAPYLIYYSLRRQIQSQVTGIVRSP